MAQKKLTQKQRILKFMQGGRFLSTKQARSLFGSKSPTARIRELRKDGAKIVLTKNTRGEPAYQLLQLPV